MIYLVPALIYSLFVFKSFASSMVLPFILSQIELKPHQAISLNLISAIAIYSVHFQIGSLSFEQAGMYMLAYFTTSSCIYALNILIGRKFAMVLSFIPFGLVLGRGSGMLSSLATVMLVYHLNVDEVFLRKLIPLLALLGTYFSSVAVDVLMDSDPPRVVVDEVVGVLIALVFFPFNFKSMLIAWGIFTLLDVLKPFPINLAQSIRGEVGVMLDDALAGFIAGLVWISTDCLLQLV